MDVACIMRWAVNRDLCRHSEAGAHAALITQKVQFDSECRYMEDEIEVNTTDPVFGMSLGKRKIKTHPESECAGRDIPCCIHSPSNHHMRDWPMNWRADTQVMERVCPHGVGHPDPDHLAYVRSLTPEHRCIFNRNQTYSFEEWLDLDEQDDCPFPHLEWQAVHGCCGCCQVA